MAARAGDINSIRLPRGFRYDERLSARGAWHPPAKQVLFGGESLSAAAGNKDRHRLEFRKITLN
jgi:hypothetical protein